MSVALLSVADTILSLSPVAPYSKPFIDLLRSEEADAEDRLRALMLSIGKIDDSKHFVRDNGLDRLYHCAECGNLELLRVNTRPIINFGVSDMLRISKLAGIMSKTEGSDLKQMLSDLKKILGVDFGNINSFEDIIALFQNGSLSKIIDNLYYNIAGENGSYVHTCTECDHQFEFSLKE